MKLILALVAAALLAAPSSAVEYKWTGNQFVMASTATAADETVITETELLAATPRRTVTRTTTASVGWSAAPVQTAACAPMAAAACSSSTTRTVTRSSIRQFAPVRRLFGVRLRGGC